MLDTNIFNKLLLSRMYIMISTRHDWKLNTGCDGSLNYIFTCVCVYRFFRQLNSISNNYISKLTHVYKF